MGGTISNVIQIKRGATAPGDNNLAPYELGYIVNRYVENGVAKDNSNGGYLYIGDLKEIVNGNPVYESIPVKVKYADNANIANTANTTNGFSANAQNLIKEIKVNNAIGSDYTLGVSQDSTISAKRNTLTWFQTNSSYVSVGATTENCIPTGYWWNIIRFNHWNENSLHYTDFAIPMNDTYTGLCYKQVIEGSVRNSSWINILDAYNYSNYALPVTGGTIQLGNAGTNEIKTAITISTERATNEDQKYGANIKFLMMKTEPLRYASIEGYANSHYANTTGLRFKIYSNEGDAEAGSNGFIEATFAKGVFTAPQFATKKISPTSQELEISATSISTTNLAAGSFAVQSSLVVANSIYGSKNPNTAGVSGTEGQLYFQVVS